MLPSCPPRVARSRTRNGRCSGSSRCSALPADTELSCLNRDGRVRAGPELLEVVRLALAARQRSGGRFDPTVLPALVAAGYDRSFESVSPDGPSVTAPPPSLQRTRAHRRPARPIEVDPGVYVDLGHRQGRHSRSAVPDARSPRPVAGQPRRGTSPRRGRRVKAHAP